MPSEASDLAGWLDGHWAVDRVINDGAGEFSGVAAFTGEGPGAVLWCETGQLRLGDHRGPAGRTLRLAQDDDRTWRVHFDDGRLFHALDLHTGHCRVEHRCGSDVYRGVYAVLDPDHVTVTWRVVGPGRDDVIASDYRRGQARAA